MVNSRASSNILSASALPEARDRVEKYGRRAFYGGIMILIAAVVTFGYMFFWLIFLKSDDETIKKLSEKINLKDTDMERQGIVDQGNHQALKFAYMINSLACFVLVMMGCLFISATKSTLQLVTFSKNGIRAPDELTAKTSSENFLE